MSKPWWRNIGGAASAVDSNRKQVNGCRSWTNERAVERLLVARGLVLIFLTRKSSSKSGFASIAKRWSFASARDGTNGRADAATKAKQGKGEGGGLAFVTNSVCR